MLIKLFEHAISALKVRRTVNFQFSLRYLAPAPASIHRRL
jgi:hypothetical protein